MGSKMGGLVAMVLACALAFADEPVVTVEADGTVVAEVLVPATEQQVRSILDDPVQAARLSPDVIDAEVVDIDSRRCARMRLETRGLFRPLRLFSRRCPSEDGYTEELVQSDDFDAYESSWALSEQEGGTQVRLRSRARVDLPVPSGALERNQRRSVEEMLLELIRLSR